MKSVANDDLYNNPLYYFEDNGEDIKSISEIGDKYVALFDAIMSIVAGQRSIQKSTALSLSPLEYQMPCFIVLVK